ncbi:MAG: ThiF family adenylyltransferase [Oliverpabstia sp.]
MINQFSRTELLIGTENMTKLYNARVAVFGIGGVGGYVVEALARSGVGTLDLVDNDQVCLTNLNRQIIATTKTIGQYKVDAAKERILEINPDAVVHVYKTFYLPENKDQFDFRQYDYVVDAIDTVSGKLALAEQAHAAGVPIISSMGAGNKMDPTAFRVADINQTSVCPLAKVMRRELKKRGISRLKVVYSEEKPLSPYPGVEIDSQEQRRQTPGSNAFVPSVVGLIIAGEVIKDLISSEKSIQKKPEMTT